MRVLVRRGGVLFGLLASLVIVVCVLTFAGIYVARSIRVATRDGRNGRDARSTFRGAIYPSERVKRPAVWWRGSPLIPEPGCARTPVATLFSSGLRIGMEGRKGSRYRRRT